MGKSTKKSASKAGAASTKPSKKGKRGAEDVANNGNCKKRKKDLVEENRNVAKTAKVFIKEKGDYSVDEQQLKVKVSVDINPIDSNPRLEGVSSDVMTDACVPKETPAIENGHVDESENGPPEEESEDREPQRKKIKIPHGTINPIGSNSKASKDDSSVKDVSSEEEEPSKMMEADKSISLSKENNSSEELSSDEDIAPSSDEAEDADVKMTDVSTKAAEMDATPKEQPAGSKTLFIGNLPFSVEQAEVEDFFKATGEIVGVRLAKGPDSSFRGFGHVEFATAEGAAKALNELNGKDLVGRPVRLDLAIAKEKGSHTPNSGEKEEVRSFQKGGRAPRQTIFVRGFNKDDGEDQIRNALEDHFGSCGEITRVSIPTDKDGGIRGIAYIDFKDHDAYNQALEFNGSKFRETTLTVDAANPKDDGFRGGRGSGGRFSGHQRGARSGRGHLSGGRHSGRGRGRAAPQAKLGGR